MKPKRCPSGVPGLDEVLDGGFPRGRCILVVGPCGAGKSTLGAQFLYNGVLKYDEPGILVTLEQDGDEICYDMLLYGMDLRKLESGGKLAIVDGSVSKVGLRDYITPPPSKDDDGFNLLPGELNFEKITSAVLKVAKKIKAKRVVVDSLSALDYLIDDSKKVRSAVVSMSYKLKRAGLTVLFITEMDEDRNVPRRTFEEYISDGVLILKTNDALNLRTLRIKEMRTTDHTLRALKLIFTEKGLAVEQPGKK